MLQKQDKFAEAEEIKIESPPPLQPTPPFKKMLLVTTTGNPLTSRNNQLDDDGNKWKQSRPICMLQLSLLAAVTSARLRLRRGGMTLAHLASLSSGPSSLAPSPALFRFLTFAPASYSYVLHFAWNFALSSSFHFPSCPPPLSRFLSRPPSISLSLPLFFCHIYRLSSFRFLYLLFSHYTMAQPPDPSAQFASIPIYHNDIIILLPCLSPSPLQSPVLADL